MKWFDLHLPFKKYQSTWWITIATTTAVTALCIYSVLHRKQSAFSVISEQRHKTKEWDWTRSKETWFLILALLLTSSVPLSRSETLFYLQNGVFFTRSFCQTPMGLLPCFFFWLGFFPTENCMDSLPNTFLIRPIVTTLFNTGNCPTIFTHTRLDTILFSPPVTLIT